MCLNADTVATSFLNGTNFNDTLDLLENSAVFRLFYPKLSYEFYIFESMLIIQC